MVVIKQFAKLLYDNHLEVLMEDLDPPFNFDLEKLTASINSGVISFPRGLTGEERREFLRKRLEEIDAQEKAE